MSYNIDTWKTKKLESLVIPLKSLFIHDRTDWHPSQPEIINAETNEVSIKCGCGQEIKAILKDGNLHITEFEIYGEGSETLMNWILEPALKQSTGKLEAVLVWEGGDSITRLSVNNGELKSENVELQGVRAISANVLAMCSSGL